MSLFELLGMFLFYTLVTFGNALVMFPILRQELVINRHVITGDQLLYAFAVARVTPGLFNLYVATIGYMLSGVIGAVLSTVVIALPAFIIIPLHKLYDRVRSNRFIANFVIGITATSIGLIFGAVFDMGTITLTGAIPWIVFITTIVLSRIIKKNAFFCFLLASIFGIILKFLFTLSSN